MLTPHRHDHLVVSIDDRLAVVALQHVAITLDDVTVGIGEVPLDLGGWAAIGPMGQAAIGHGICRLRIQPLGFKASHGRHVRWQLRARNATDAIRERWVGASWIIELVSTGHRDGEPFHHVHLFITTSRTSSKALLRQVRQRWAIENQWHWPRDTQLGEHAHRYSHRNGVQVLAARHIQKTRCNRMGLGSWGGQGTVRVWGYHTNPDPSGFPDPSPG